MTQRQRPRANQPRPDQQRQRRRGADHHDHPDRRRQAPPETGADSDAEFQPQPASGFQPESERDELELEGEPQPRPHLFGAAVRAHRLGLGMSLNKLARGAGVDPAYIHRIESAAAPRPPVPRRAVVVAIAGALRLDRRQTDELLARAGYVPDVLLALGGWDDALGLVAEVLVDAELSAAARVEFRELLRILARRWGKPSPGELGPPSHS
ncbi:MAG: helix-turn-helix domain-containing protein [Chloroflexota bacterium]|nr:helix-turn-helix domain-containing protein [Chloroflexota bacterium]